MGEDSQAQDGANTEPILPTLWYQRDQCLYTHQSARRVFALINSWRELAVSDETRNSSADEIENVNFLIATSYTVENAKREPSLFSELNDR